MARAGCPRHRLLANLDPTEHTTSRNGPNPHVPLLRTLDLLRPLSDSRLERLAETVVTMGYAAGVLIVRESDPCEYLYVVVEGEVLVLVSGRVVAVLGPHQYFGETALLGGTPHCNTVVARVPSRLYALDGREFVAAIESSARGPSATATPAEEDLTS